MMQMMKFGASKLLSLGVELELQLIDPESFDLFSGAKEVLRNLRKLDKNNESCWQFKPEITQSMIELNTSVHHNANELLIELLQARDSLSTLAKNMKLYVCGGGTHPFQKWQARQIFPVPRYETLLAEYGYLAKRFTVFGQHIHLGCENPEQAIYLTHALSRYIPHFIALSAASPFYQGVDTHFACTRINIINAFPTSGVMPLVRSWQEFCDYFTIMHDMGIVRTMKDFYWDIRPKPEYGSVEIRICDTPLTVQRAAELAAYAQALASYLLSEKPLALDEKLYLPYSYNRFQAARYGLDANFIDPITQKPCSLWQDIAFTFENIKDHAAKLQCTEQLQKLRMTCENQGNHADLMREYYAQSQSLPLVVKMTADTWSSS